MLLIKICEAINQRSKWVCQENIFQMLHLIMVSVYLVLVYPDCQGPWSGLAGLVVCLAWLAGSYSMKYLMFGRWSSMGLYMSMLLNVSQNIQ